MPRNLFRGGMVGAFNTEWKNMKNEKEEKMGRNLYPDEKILVPPRLVYIFEGNMPFVFTLFHKSGTLCLTNKRLWIIT